MRIGIAPEVTELAAGDELELLVTLANDGDDPISPALAVEGIDADRVSFADDVIALAPGARAHTIVRVRVPRDAPVGEQRIAVTVSDRDGGQPTVGASASIRVGDKPTVSLELSPSTVRGRRHARFEAILQNDAGEPVTLRLDAAGEDIGVWFLDDEVDLDVEDAVSVPAEIVSGARTWFREIRHGALIEVRGRGAPTTAMLTFTQKPFFSPLFTKAVAVVTVLALWASAVFVINTQLDPDRRQDQAVDQPPPDAGTGRPPPQPGGPDDGTDATAGAPVVVHGAVVGPRDPAGTDVVIERISFGDAGTTSGQAGTRIAPMTQVALPVGRVIDRIETSTDERGRFRFSGGLAAPAFYRVTALRPGFEVVSVVAQTTAEEKEVEVSLAMKSAPAAMAGRVTTPGGGALGGATVTVTDGQLTYRTTTATEGAAAGTWSLEGLASPATYQVIVSRHGHATATLLVGLDGGQHLGGVDAVLHPNLGTLRGRVTYRDEGVGAVSVTLAGEGVERTTTTFTGELAEGVVAASAIVPAPGAGLRGRFEFPALPYGVYQLTFEAPGWLTQTSEVVVGAGDVELLVRDLRPSTAIVQGSVAQEVAPGGCAYPDPDVPEQRTRAVMSPCGGVGVSAIGPGGTFRTTTASGTGYFQLAGLPAGEYSIQFERFGYVSEFIDVEVEAGDVVTLPEDDPDGHVQLRLLPLLDGAVGEINAVIRDATDPEEVFAIPANTSITVVDQPAAVVERLADGAIHITSVVPGAPTVRIDAPGFDVREVVVRVAAAGPTDAGTILLTPLATLALRVTDADEAPIAGAEIFVTAAEGEAGEGARLSAVSDENVSACSASKDAAGRWRIGAAGTGAATLQGLCATVTLTGDVTMRRALGSGSYRVITPANSEDLAERGATPEERRIRAGTVPLDHQQLERGVEVRSGETTRLDLRARRFAVIEGRVREPSGDGFVNVTRAAFTHNDLDGLGFFPAATTFEDVNGITIPLGMKLELTENGEPVTPPTGLLPRVSYGPADGLPVGMYRINRVLADEPEVTREYLLGFYANSGLQFEYRGSNVLSALSFGETRLANAVLSPAPIDVDFRVVRELRSGDTVPVAGVALTITGITEFVFEGGNVFPIMQTVNIVSGADGRARAVDEHGEPVLFVELQPLDVRATHADYEVLEADDLIPERGKPLLVVVKPFPRIVSGSVQIVPLAGSDVTTLQGLTLELHAVDADPPFAVTGPTTQVVNGNRLDFTFATVDPDVYRLEVTGANVFDYTSVDLDVPPGPQATPVRVGPSGVQANPPPFPVDRKVSLAVDVTEVFPAGDATLDVADATVRLFLDGVEVGVETTDASGRASFADLRGGPSRSYHVTLTKQGYFSPAGTNAPFTLSAVSNSITREQIRFGAIIGHLESWISDDDSLGHLEAATITLVSTGGTVVAGIDPQSSDADGEFEFPHTAEIPAGGYLLRITHDDHDTKFVEVTVADATVTDMGTVRVDQKRASISGKVTNVEPTGDPLPFVRVQARHPTLGVVYAETVTDALGNYALFGLPPRELDLRFEEFTDATLTVETSRKTHELTRTPGPGESLTDIDIAMAEEWIAIQGVVTGRDFADAAAASAPLAGVTVTATCTSPSPDPTAEPPIPARCVPGAQQERTTDENGHYAFNVLPAGTYSLTFSRSGYTTVTIEDVVIVRFTAEAPPVNATVVALPVDVVVTVTSADAVIGALEDITVTAVYDGTPVPTTGHNPSYVFSGSTDVNGQVTLTLPPGPWDVTTSGADAVDFEPRPHRDMTERLEFVGDPTPVPRVDITLTPYVKVAGVVLGRDYVGATLRGQLKSALAVPRQQGALPTAYPADEPAATPTGDDGAWVVYLPPAVGVGTETWEIELTHPDYEGALVIVDLDSGTGDLVVDDTAVEVTVDYLGDLAAELTELGVVVTASPVAVPVLVRSQTGSTPLDNITVVASPNGFAPPVDAPYMVSAVTSPTGEAQLLLAPGTWELSTTDADVITNLPQRPHLNRDGVDVALFGPGATVATQTITLFPYVELSGVAQGRAFVGATPSNLAAVTVTPSRAGETRHIFGTTTVASGAWQVYVPPSAPGQPWTLTLDHDHYDEGVLTVDAGSADRALADGGFTSVVQQDLFPVEVVGNNGVLTATPVDVVVTVVDAVDSVPVAGVTVTATHPGSPAPPEVPRYVRSGVSAENTGQVTLTLPPSAAGAWRLATTGGASLQPPYTDVSDVALVAVVSGTEPTQTLSLSQNLRLTILVEETFPASGGSVLPVSGASVQLFQGSGANRTAVLVDGQPVIGTTGADGRVVFTPLNNKTQYSVNISKLGWRDLTNVAGGQWQGTSDEERTATLVRYGAVTGTAVTLVDGGLTGNGFEGGPLVGATVTLTGNSQTRTVTTDANGAFTFSHTEEIPAFANYTVTITAPNHVTRAITNVAVADRTITSLGTRRVEASRASVTGTIRAPDLQYVRVTAIRSPALGGQTVVTSVNAGQGTDGTLGYSVTNLPPSGLASDPSYTLTLRFEEFADANYTIHTSRAVLDVDVSDLGAGEDRTGVDAQMVTFAALQGTVTGRDHAEATSSALADATVTARCTATQTNGCTLNQTTQRTTGGDGTYTYQWLRIGTYELTFTKDGYGTETHAAVVIVRFATQGETVNRLLTATPRVVAVSVVSSAGGAALSGVEVVATGPAGAPGPYTATTNGSGVATFGAGPPDERLAPGSWTFSTSSGSTLTPPHVDETGAARTVPVGTGTLAFDEADDTNDRERLTLTRYVRIDGTVVPRAFGGGPSPAAFAGAAAEASDGTDTFPGTVGALGAADGSGVRSADWSVFVPPSSASTPWTVTLSATGYESDDSTVANVTTTDVTEPTAVDLIATPRDVVVTVESDDGDVPLDGVTVTASWAGTGSGPSGGSYVWTGATDPDGEVTLTLAPAGAGDWELSTSGADSLTPPHVDVSGVALAAVPVAPGAVPTPTLTLAPFVPVEGIVSTRDYDGATATATDGVSVTVDEPADGVAESATSGLDGTAGKWRVWVPPATTSAEIEFALDGYESETLIVPAATFGAPQTVTLTATPRDVVVTVTSGGGGGLEALTVTAAWAGTGVGPSGAPYELTGGTGVGGAVTLTLAPAAAGDWELSTTGADGLTPPHVDVAGVAVAAVPLAPGAAPTPTLTLDPYVEITGTVSPRAFDGGPSPDVFAGAAVEASDGTVTRTGTVGQLGTAVGGVRSADWSVFVPPSSASTPWTVTLAATGYESDGSTVANVTAADVPVSTPIDLIATAVVVDVTVLSGGAGNPTIEGAIVTATYTGPGTTLPGESGSDKATGGDGVASFTLPPGSWSFGATAASHQPGSSARTIGVGDTDLSVIVTLNTNSVLVGRVVESQVGELAPVAGVTVRAERDGETYSTVSTEPLDNGDNFRLKARSGTWRITAVRDGETYLVDEAFEIRKDEPGSEPNWLEIVMPAKASTALSGTVLDDAGNGVAGATVTATSTTGSFSTTTGEDGFYALPALASDVTWKVTFTPPDGAPGRPVSRYIAPGNGEALAIVLDQTIPSGLGDLVVEIDGGAPGAAVTVTLAESSPFPTVAADGQLVRTATVDSHGTAVVTFAGLVPGDGNSVPQNRFGLTIDVDGHHTITRTGLEVIAGTTTTVEITLGPGTAKTRTVELTLTSDGEPVADRTVLLRKDGTTWTGTVPAGSNVYTFSGIVPGTWTVLVDGYEEATLTVPSGDGLYAATVALVRVEEVADEPGVECPGDDVISDGPVEEACELGEEKVGELEDVVGDLLDPGAGADPESSEEDPGDEEPESDD